MSALAPSGSSRAEPPRRRARLEASFWLVPIAAGLIFPDHRVLATQVVVSGLFVLSLDLILGYAGVVSLGHAAFFGVGAYTAGLCAVHGWAEPLSGLAAAGAAAAIAGYASSFLVVGGSGLTRLMVTLGIGLSLYEAANRASAITGGVEGLSGIDMQPLLGVFEFGIDGTTAYVYALAVVFGCFLLVRRAVASPFGLSLVALRENERRLPALGVPVRRRLIEVYTAAAAVAGVAGALAAQTTEFVGLEVLSLERSSEALIMLVLGGAGRLYGAFIGAAAFMLLRDVFSEQNPVYWQFWLGLAVASVAWLGRVGQARDLARRAVGGLGRAVGSSALRRARPARDGSP